MRRREVLILVAGAAGAAAISPVRAAADSISAALDAISPEVALATAQVRELQFRQVISVEAQGQTRRLSSDREISGDAFKLILTFEVSSQAYYKKALTRPIWPKGNSGVTFGIGYDIGYMSAKTFRSDWDAILDEATMAVLETAAGKKGADAKAIVKNYQNISIDWTEAEKQFRRYVPYVVGEMEAAFPNTENLNGDCRGALVSLVYNRGSKIDGTKRRREMLNIRTHLKKGDLDLIPQEFIAMTRLWDIDELPGLHTRRNLEAALFQRGLNDARG